MVGRSPAFNVNQPVTDASRERATLGRLSALRGSAPCMRELFRDLERIAATDVTVLVEGETGAGKELVAETLHQASSRATGPFVVFDCGAITPTLANSELFGHERGAFTGAVGARAGVFEQADGGTIFFDELGELSLDLQPKLLRALEKREVRRIGGQRSINVDVRVVAATNRDLAAEVKRGRFREDLYFRFAAARVRVPPLRDRLEDLPLLVEHFASRATPPRRADEIAPHVWDALMAHDWPGNVRELRNVVEGLFVMPERTLQELEGRAPPPASAKIATAPPRDALDALTPFRVARREAIRRFEADYLRDALERAEGNVSRAAAIAEVSRQLLHKLIRKHGWD